MLSIIEVLFPSREVFEFAFGTAFLEGSFFEEPCVPVFVDLHAVLGGGDEDGLCGLGGGFPVAEVGFGAFDVVGLEDAFFVDAGDAFLGEVELFAGYGTAHDGVVDAVAAFFPGGLVVGKVAAAGVEGLLGNGDGLAGEGQFAAGALFAEGANPQQALKGIGHGVEFGQDSIRFLPLYKPCARGPPAQNVAGKDRAGE